MSQALALIPVLQSQHSGKRQKDQKFKVILGLMLCLGQPGLHESTQLVVKALCNFYLSRAGQLFRIAPAQLRFIFLTVAYKLDKQG